MYILEKKHRNSKSKKIFHIPPPRLNDCKHTSIYFFSFVCIFFLNFQNWDHIRKVLLLFIFALTFSYIMVLNCRLLRNVLVMVLKWACNLLPRCCGRVRDLCYGDVSGMEVWSVQWATHRGMLITHLVLFHSFSKCTIIHLTSCYFVFRLFL